MRVEVSSLLCPCLGVLRGGDVFGSVARGSLYTVDPSASSATRLQPPTTHDSRPLPHQFTHSTNLSLTTCTVSLTTVAHHSFPYHSLPHHSLPRHALPYHSLTTPSLPPSLASSLLHSTTTSLPHCLTASLPTPSLPHSLTITLSLSHFLTQ